MLICFLVVVEALLKVIGDSDDERPRIQNPEFEPRTWFSILKIGFFLVFCFIYSFIQIVSSELGGFYSFHTELS